MRNARRAPRPAACILRILTATLVAGLLAAGCRARHHQAHDHQHGHAAERKVPADAWPQWGGPNRDFTVEGRTLAKAWPEEGPRQLWSRPLGDGYSTIVADGKRIYTMYRNADDREAVVALDPATGKTVWEHAYDAPLVKQDEEDGQSTRFGKGPNSTPLLHAGRLFSVGHVGRILCLDPGSGRVHWTREQYHELGGTLVPFGYSASPVAYRDTIILPIGGEGRGVMALRQADGTIAWQSTDYAASYSSPLLIKVDGQDHLVLYLSGEIVGLDPATGDLHWHIEHKNQWGTSIVTPIWGPDNLLYFVVGGDEAGGRVVRLSIQNGRVTPADVWTNRKISGSLSNPVLVDELLYGDNGGSASMFTAFRIETGEILWQDRAVKKAIPLCAGGQFLLLDEKGTLHLATADAEGLTLHGSRQLLEDPSWSAPTLVGTRLFLRDRKMITAVDLGG